MDQFTISVKIAERVYRMKIRPEEEEGIRKAAKLINEKVKDYSNTYAFFDFTNILKINPACYEICALLRCDA